MNKIEVLTSAVATTKILITGAEAVLNSGSQDEKSKVETAGVLILEIKEAYANVMLALTEAEAFYGKPDRAKPAPTLADLAEVGRKRGEREAALTAAGRPVN